MNNKKRNVLITGAAGLLGIQHAAALIEKNFNVILIDKNLESLKKVKKKLKSKYPKAEIIISSTDITKEQKIKKLKNFLQKKKITIDTLINNAAANPKMSKYNKSTSGMVENYNTNFLIEEINVGILGAFFCSKIFGSDMAKRNFGVIINIGSDLAINSPDHSVYHKSDNIDNVRHFKPIGYSITKFGLLGLTKYLGTYWARKNVRCNMLIPGAVENKQPKFLIKNVKKRIPMNRWAKPDEYKKAIQFLCSDSSVYMTGQTLIIDGGRTVW